MKKNEEIEKKEKRSLSFYYKKYINVLKNQLKTKIDVVMMAYFFGRWIPYAIAIGIVTGTLAAIMDLFIIKINIILNTNLILMLIYPLMISLLTGYIIEKYPNTGGPGIGYSILHIKTNRYIKFPSLLFKFITSTFTLAGGFIAGREGPSFFLGTGLGEWMGKAYGLGKKNKSILGLIGGGAFTGSLLKAPLGSSIFAMEIENEHDLDYRPFVPMIIASVVSYLTFSFFRGNHPFIMLNENPYWNLKDIPYIIIMGFIISIITYIYTIIYQTSTKFSKYIKPRIRPVIGTLIAIPLLFALFYITQNRNILSAPAHMMIISDIAQNQFKIYADIAIIALTVLVTSFTLGFGIPGGLVLPNLLIGAAVGNIFGHYFPNEIVMFSLAGMGAALAAGAKTPLAAIVMITEMTHADVVIPMTAAVITSYTTSFGYSLYVGLEKGQFVK